MDEDLREKAKEKALDGIIQLRHIKRSVKQLHYFHLGIACDTPARIAESCIDTAIERLATILDNV